MNIEEKYFQAVEDMEIISRHLSELSNMVATIYMGLEIEKMEKQVLDCVACIGCLVKTVHGLTENMLYEVKEMKNTEG